MESVAALRHPHIVEVYEVTEEEDGSMYAVMEVCSGVDLQRLVARRGYLVSEEVGAIVCGVLRGLVAAHSAGLVHLDLQPSNVVVDEATLQAKIVDWGGYSKQVPEGHNLNHPYTALYQAPEQFDSGPTRASVDGRTDLWATGVMIYHCLTGAYPFGSLGARVESIRAAVRGPDGPPNLIHASQRRASEDLKRLVEDALMKDIPRRIGSATDMLRRLQDILRKDMEHAATINLPKDKAGPTLAAVLRAISNPPEDPLMILCSELQEVSERRQRETQWYAVREMELLVSEHHQAMVLEHLASEANTIMVQLEEERRKAEESARQAEEKRKELMDKEREAGGEIFQLGDLMQQIDKLQKDLLAKTTDVGHLQNKLNKKHTKMQQLFRQVNEQKEDYIGKIRSLDQVNGLAFVDELRYLDSKRELNHARLLSSIWPLICLRGISGTFPFIRWAFVLRISDCGKKAAKKHLTTTRLLVLPDPGCYRGAVAKFKQ